MQETQEYLTFYETRNSEKFVTSDNPENLRLVQRMASWLQLAPSDKVLDIGCSDGYFLERLRDRCSLENAAGIDVSEAATKKAQRLTAGKSGLRFVVGSVQALPFPAGSFDKIILNEVIEHVPDAEKALSEVSRVARPGALIFATSPNAFDELLPIFRPHARKVDQVEGHVRRYSLKTLTEAVHRHGFDVLRVRYNGFLATFVWYSAIIYNQPLKKFAMRLITRSAPTIGSCESGRPRFNLVSLIPFVAMHLVKLIDAPFEGYHRGMGIHVLLRKRM